ncbi:hypothetical protein JJJ17_10225 [Paracoccus caeni]|uniref:Uncharacterized protein n=1 Tax=Paracoccus caeni TaxID=657651 RepID=A0A934VUX8_9RHOB|nr:hypothetical protein [Paracoccus caeni]MBK4216301.1 hypothetical protein [Paracoccus caeni]
MKPAAYLLIGIVLLAFGIYRQFLAPQATAEERAQCEQVVRDTHPNDQQTAESILIHCDEPSMVAMMEARLGNTDAQRAATAIAASHHRGLAVTLINCALIGAGIGALGAGAMATRRKQA